MAVQRRAGLGIALVLLAVAVASSAWLVPRLDLPPQFWLSPIETVTVGGRPMRVVRLSYSQGLRDVPTLGGLDGALFVLDGVATTAAGATMDEAVVIPLDIAFFDQAGRFTDRFTMPPCATDCPVVYPHERADHGAVIRSFG